MYLWNGGDAGGSGSSGGSGGDPDDPGGDGGGGTIIGPNDYDKNNDSIIDCFNGSVMHRSDLKVTSCFGMRCLNGECKMHYGVDISTSSIRGELIYSLTDGEVVEIGEKPDYGNYISKN